MSISFLSSSPSTPTTKRHYTTYDTAPAFSSPLASPPSSPVSAAQERRRSSQQSDPDSTPRRARHRPSIKLTSTSRRPSGRYSRSINDAPDSETPQKKLLRERFRAQCIERAVRDRQRKISGKRAMLDEQSSDMECEDEDVDEDEFDELMNDELFRRIMASVDHKRKHSYRVSYSRDVGSSFDPAMEEGWEDELKDDTAEKPQEVALETIDDNELAEWAAEQELLEGLNPDDIFSLSDLDEPPDAAPADEEETMWRAIDKGKGRAFQPVDDDVEMDL